MGPVGGRFQLVQKLGEGAYGEAHLAQDSDGTNVVVKLLHEKLAKDRDQLERFRREVVALGRLAHPHVVALVASGTDEDSGRPFYATRFCPGVPLSRILREEGSLVLPRGVRLMDQLLAALEAAHAIGIVHRDLKPDNLLVEEPGTERESLRVLDFGLAKHLAGGREEMADLTGKKPVGTPFYMAPEQCFGDTISPRTDIYGVGCILMEVFTGQPPFLGKTALEVLQRQVAAAPPSLTERRSDLPQLLATVVDTCLAKDAPKRPTATHLRQLLGEVLAHFEERVPTIADARPSEDALTIVPGYARENPAHDAKRPGSEAASAGTVRLANEPGSGGGVPLASGSTAPCPRFRFDVELGGQRGRFFVFVGPTLRFGRNRRGVGSPENDLVLRAFPREGEGTKDTSRRTNDVSGHHGTFHLTPNGLALQDDGSKMGTVLEGAKLTANEPVLVPEKFVLEVGGGAVSLRCRVFTSSQGLSSLRLERLRDGEHVSYVQLLRFATIGASDDDTIVIDHPTLVGKHARLAATQNGVAIEARPDAAVSVNGKRVVPRQPVLLEKGAVVKLGEVAMTFDEAACDDMKPE